MYQANMDQIQKHVAELAIRLLAMPADGAATDLHALAEIERVATQVIRDVTAARAAAAAKSCLPGERSGVWHAVRLGR
jgi:hypothetical protein